MSTAAGPSSSDAPGRWTRSFGEAIPPSSFYASRSSSSAQSRTRTPPPLEFLPNPASTPISNKISGSQPFSSTVHSQDEHNRRRLALETSGFFLGPMPCTHFLDEFLPLAPDAETLPQTSDVFRDVASQASESAMYAPFVRLLYHCYRELQITTHRLKQRRHLVPIYNLWTLRITPIRNAMASSQISACILK